MMTSSEFQSRLDEARKVNEERDAEEYADGGRISPVQCAPYCGVLYIRTLLTRAICETDWDVAMQAASIANDMMRLWDQQNIYHCDRCGEAGNGNGDV